MESNVSVSFDGTLVYLEETLGQNTCVIIERVFQNTVDFLRQIKSDAETPTHALVLEDKNNPKNQILVIFEFPESEVLAVQCVSIHIVTNTSDSVFLTLSESETVNVEEFIEKISANLLLNLTPNK